MGNNITNNNKILIIGTNTMSIFNHRYELMTSLLKRGYQVYVAAPDGAERGEIEEMGVNFIDVDVDNRGTNPVKDLKLVYDLVRVIKKIKPAAILTFYTKTNIYGGLAARITKTPYIENITGLGSALSNGGVMQKLMIALYRAAVKDAVMIFYQNKPNQEFFQSRVIHREFGHLLPGSGVSLKRFKALEYPTSENTEFVFISRILREKGIFEYIDAARNIKAKYPETIFHVVGPADEEYKEIVESAAAENIIVYHGHALDIHPILTRTHCTVFPSYYAEGMANILLESAASGRPLITTSLPGCGETVDDGVTGFIVREKDSADLTEKIEKFISMDYDSRREMGLKGREKMKREFDREIVVNSYLDELEQNHL